MVDVILSNNFFFDSVKENHRFYFPFCSGGSCTPLRKTYFSSISSPLYTTPVLLVVAGGHLGKKKKFYQQQQRVLVAFGAGKWPPTPALLLLLLPSSSSVIVLFLFRFFRRKTVGVVFGLSFVSAGDTHTRIGQEGPSPLHNLGGCGRGLHWAFSL